MLRRSLTVLAATCLIFLSQVCLSQDGASSNSYLFIKNRIDTLLALSTIAIEINTADVNKKAEQALYLSKKINYLIGEARAAEILGRYYMNLDEFAKSLSMYMDYLTLAKQIPDISLEINANLRIAGLYFDIKNFERSEQYLETAFKIASENSHTKKMGWVYYNFAQNYYEKRDIPKAFDFSKKAFECFLLDSDNEMLAKVNKLTGDINIELGEYNEAVKAYHKAMDFFDQTPFIQEKGILYTRLAHVYRLKKNFPNVLKYNLLALREREAVGNLTLLSHSYVNIGKTYYYLGQIDSSEHYLKKGMNTALKSGINYPIQDAYLQLYRFYLEQNKLKDAIINYELFFESYKEYLNERTKSEILATEIKSQIQDIESQNQLLQQEIEIQFLEIKNRSYSELITQLIIGAIGALILIMAYIFERNKLGKSKLERINKQLNREIEERKITENQLRTSEELYRFVTDHTLDLIVRMDRNLQYLYVSPSILQMFGYGLNEIDSIPALANLIPDSFKAELRNQYVEMIRTKEPVMLTHQSKRKDGSLFWSESLMNPIFDNNKGKLIETITVIRDITERVAFEESLSENARQKELLLREVHHRVKNNFAILISLMNMQKVSSHPGDFKVFLTELQGRIRTMSLVHELLYRSHDIDYIHFGEYLGQLTGIISRAYNSQPLKIHSSIETCILDVETALPLGLICNEVLTNAFKYALDDNPAGELWIDLKPCHDNADPNKQYSHRLTIRDNGPGLPVGYSPVNQTSMGSQIIALLIEQLEGKLEYSGDEGVLVSIYFSDEKRS
ncbi:MAG: PAS domain S-box protein [Bacteroidales bacterium]|nr:PAS domain S-box protein [Bacteroidales bacterium]